MPRKTFSGVDGNWYAIRTNPNCERRAIQAMHGRGFYTFAPTAVRYVRHARRTEAKAYPLLTRYVFAFIGQSPSFYDLRGCHGVEGVVGIRGQGPCPIPDEAIDKLMADETEGVHDETKPKNVVAWREGDPVRLTPAAGVLAGQDAIIAAVESENRIRLMIGQRALTIVSPDHIERAA